MKHIKELFALFFLILFISCKSVSTLPVAQFKSVYPLTDLSGMYLSGNPRSETSLAYALLKGRLPKEYIDIAALRFNGKDSLNVRLYSGDVMVRELNYAGEVKGNFFEVSLSRNPYVLPPVFVNYNYSRIRLGLTNDNQLLLHFLMDRTEGTAIFYVTDKVDESYVYDRISENWVEVLRAGYKFMTLPDPQDVRKVRKDSLWALADKSGKLLTDFEYAFIDSYDKALAGYKVTSGANYIGYINVFGEKFIPVEYEQISNTNITNLMKVYRDGKIGFVSTWNNVLCPPCLREVSKDSEFIPLGAVGADTKMKYCKVRYQGAYYYLGLDGYLYPYSENSITGKLKKLKVAYRFKPGGTNP